MFAMVMVATRFAVAVHIALILSSEPAEPATSQLLARSVHTNPVVVRRINGMLVRAGLVKVRRGPGGASLARPATAITLADIWRAVNPGERRPVFPLHGPAVVASEHDGRLRASLGRALARAEGSLKDELSEITLADMVEDARRAA